MDKTSAILPNDEVVIRQATVSDLEILLEFEQAMIEAERPFDPAIRRGEDVRYYDLEKLIRSTDSEILVAEIGGQVIGCGYARIEPSKAFFRHDRHSYLGFMYVVPEHRGKGVNKAVLDALEAWTESRGVNEMQLEVYVQNIAAIRAYEKSGFAANVLEMRKSLRENK